MWLALAAPFMSAASGGGADEHVADADLAAAVALPVEAGEALDERAGELDLAAHVDALPGHEHVVEDHEGFLAAELRVADVERRCPRACACRSSGGRRCSRRRRRWPGSVKQTAKSSSPSRMATVGMTMISCELQAPVWWALAPRTTMPSSRFSTMCT